MLSKINDEKKINSKRISSSNELNFLKLKNTESSVTCYGRPSKKDLSNFKKDYNINLILTLQGEQEKPEEIGKACAENSIEWLHFPVMGAGNFTLLKIKDQLIELYIYLFKRLKTERIKLFVHCAAGVHRTGVFLYGLIRLSGENSEDSYSLLKVIRAHTYNHVGKERISFFETAITKSLLKGFYGNEYKEEKKQILEESI
jgi:protein-tyrosine phosphatase